MKDVWAIFKKEIKEWLRARESARWTLVSLAVAIGVWGVMMPIQMGASWRAGVMPAALYTLLPLFVANALVADSFAGERERKTLETLLATRLPDWAIFLGKVAAAVAYAWGVTLTTALAGLITVNVAESGEGPYMYPPLAIVAIVVGGLLMAFLAVGIGIFISLRAKSVRAAQQAFSLVFLVIVFGISFGLPALVNSLPESSKASLERALTTLGVGTVAALFLLALAVVDAVLMVVAIKRFQRTRLILE